MLLFSFFIFACELFQTRIPQEPSDNQSKFQPPVSDDIVIENFIHAITEANVDNYVKCLISDQLNEHTFQFFPSSDVHSQFQNFFLNWGVEDERQYFQNLTRSTAKQLSISLSNRQRFTASPDSVVYQMDYVVSSAVKIENTSQKVAGNMHLYLLADSQRRWSIYRWYDFKTTSDITWSYWKVFFSGR